MDPSARTPLCRLPRAFFTRAFTQLKHFFTFAVASSFSAQTSISTKGRCGSVQTHLEVYKTRFFVSVDEVAFIFLRGSFFYAMQVDLSVRTTLQTRTAFFRAHRAPSSRFSRHFFMSTFVRALVPTRAESVSSEAARALCCQEPSAIRVQFGTFMDAS